MDELSWKVKLAKSSINITNIENDIWYYEFPFHPKPGQVKWCKMFSSVKRIRVSDDDRLPKMMRAMNNAEMANKICEEVLAMRKELEG